MDYKNIAIEDLRSNPNQPRHEFNDAELVELAESIKQIGVLVPLLVRPMDGKFEIVHGERRWRASQNAGLTEVPVVVRPLSDDDAFVISLTENIQRQNLNPIEEAGAFRWLQERGYTQSKIAGAIGKTQQYVASRLVLLELPERVKDKITTRVVNPSHGEVLAKLKSPVLVEKLAKEIEADKLTVRQLEKAVVKLSNADSILASTELSEQKVASLVSKEVCINPKGNMSAFYEYKFEFAKREAERERSLETNGYYVDYWAGEVPQGKENTYPWLTEDEWELVCRSGAWLDYLEVYWAGDFRLTQMPTEDYTGFEFRDEDEPHRWAFFLPIGGVGWAKFPIGESGGRFKIIRRKVFIPKHIHGGDYFKVLMILSGYFIQVHSLKNIVKLLTFGKEESYPTLNTDVVIARDALLEAIAEDTAILNNANAEVSTAIHHWTFDVGDLEALLKERPKTIEALKRRAMELIPPVYPRLLKLARKCKHNYEFESEAAKIIADNALASNNQKAFALGANCKVRERTD